jgi:hypothetical protein
MGDYRMSLDLFMWGANRAAIRDFGLANNLLETSEDEDGNPTKALRRGVEFSPWNGSGELVTNLRNVEITRDVAVIQEGVPAIPAIPEVTDIDGNVLEAEVPGVPGIPAEFAFNVNGNFPAWLDETVTAVDGVTQVGRWVRNQGNFAVFSGVATVGQTLDITTEDRQTLPGYCALLRLHFTVEEEDRVDDDEVDVEEGPWKRSKVARYIKRNGTPGTISGLNYYTVDGVRLFKYQDVVEWCNTRGVPSHGFL